MADEIASIATVVAIGPLTLRIKTSFPDPLLPIELYAIPIMSRAWADAHEATIPSLKLAR